MTQQTHGGGTALPWAAFTLGAAGSLAANLLDAVEAVHAVRNGVAVEWHELAAALFFAALVPVALLLVVEMLIRSGKDANDGLSTIMWVGAAAVAAGAAIMSFGHMYKVMVGYGQPPLFAALMPLAVDGLMLVASVALARAGRAAPMPDAETQPTASVPHVADVPEVQADAVPSVPVRLAAVPEQGAAPVPERADVPGAVPEDEDAVPADVPESVTVPDLRAVGDERETARDYVRAAFRDGRKVVGKDVAGEFGKSERWGRSRVAEVRAELADTDEDKADA